MKTNAIIRIVLLSIAILVLLSILGAGLVFGLFAFDTESDTSAFNQELPVASDGEVTRGSVDAASIHNIDISWISGSVTISPHAEPSEIVISESGNDNEKYNMVYSREGNTLKIDFCDDNTRFSTFGVSMNVDKDLVILVPEGWQCSQLNIDTVSADVTVRNLDITEADCNSASAQCYFEDCTIGELSMDTASGDLEYSGALDCLDFDGASANCSVAVSNVPRSVEVDAASGNLDLYLPDDCGFTCEVEAISGSFSSDFETTSHHGHHRYGDGGCRIQVDAISGDVKIHRNGGHHH